MTNESLRRVVTYAKTQAERNLDDINETIADRQAGLAKLVLLQEKCATEVAELTEALDAIEKAGE